jgi:penicillin-binding protein 2
MTFLFDPAKGMDALRGFESQWGGTAQQRLERRYAAYAAERGESVQIAPRRDEDVFAKVEDEARLAAEKTQKIGEDFVAPRDDPFEAGSAPPAAAIPDVGGRE